MQATGAQSSIKLRWAALVFTFLVTPLLSFCQDYVYVNTDSLLLRDRPGKTYMVYSVLSAPSKLKVEPYDDFYKRDKGVTSRFYQVSITYYDANGRSTYSGGFVDKKYVVKSLASVTKKGVDTSLELNARHIHLYSYIGDDKHSPNSLNCRDFPYPRYKGGEHSFPPPEGVRTYECGPRGGCYYRNPKGNKVYVDSKFCKGCK